MSLLSGAARRDATDPAQAVAGSRARWWAWLLAWLAFLPIAVLRAGTLGEGDTFWEVRTGLVIISHRAIPTVDTFSWTAHGEPWTLNSWAFDVFLGAACRLGGLTLVAWACTALVMTVVALAMVLARRLGAPPAAAAMVMLLATPVVVGWLSARPQLVDYVAAPALVLLLRRLSRQAGAPKLARRRLGRQAGPGKLARRRLGSGRDRLKTLGGVGLLSVAWVNLHAGALLGVAIAGAAGAVLLARRDTREPGWWCLAAAGTALVCSFVNPYGFAVIAQTEHVRAASAGIIAEWEAFSPASPAQWVILAGGVAALYFAWRRHEQVLVAALAVVLAASLAAQRFQPILVVLVIPVLAAVAPSFPLPGPVLRYLRDRAAMFAHCSLVGLAILAASTIPTTTHIGRPDPAAYPVSIMRDIPAGCRLFNSYLIGSYVILARPDVPVSLDTRTDLYGRTRIIADERTLQGQGNLTKELAGAGCVLVPPHGRLSARLRHDPAWRLTASDQAAVLFERRLAA